MAEGILTEREWRRQAVRAPKQRPQCWGAQCMLRPARRGVKQNRALHARLLLASFFAALILPFATPRKAEPLPEYQTTSAALERAEDVSARTLSAVEYGAPSEIVYGTRTCTREELLRGKLLLMDGAHPLPKDVPAPNTMSVATYGKGMVPVNDLTVKSGRETIAALGRLFAAIRGKGAGGFAVCRATMTPLEQREWRLQRLRVHAEAMSLQDAIAKTLAETDAPGTGELQQEYAVELRLVTGAQQKPDERPLEATRQGQTLLQNAWRSGFIRVANGTGGERDYRFRYVGEAHATAMTFLDLDLRRYLELLHQKRTLLVRRDENTSYLIQCLPLNGGYVEFTLPKEAACEVSLDNMGYAVAACVLQGAR